MRSEAWRRIHGGEPLPRARAPGLRGLGGGELPHVVLHVGARQHAAKEQQLVLGARRRQRRVLARAEKKKQTKKEKEKTKQC